MHGVTDLCAPGATTAVTGWNLEIAPTKRPTRESAEFQWQTDEMKIRHSASFATVSCKVNLPAITTRSPPCN